MIIITITTIGATITTMMAITASMILLLLPHYH